MPSQPTGEVPPADGELPADSVAAFGRRDFGVYVHVPFCATRCGYCDFNTYTAPELTGAGSVDRESFAEYLKAEVDLARRVLGPQTVPVQSVFVGGGTPTLLDPADLGSVVQRIDARFGLAAEAEITVEANPDSVDAQKLPELRHRGVNRISFGMQSAVGTVLAVLDRTHTPGGALRAVEQARAAGFERISLDLIYGTPGETLADWQTSVDAALSAGVSHISAYALIVEPGTRLAAAVRRGTVTAPDDDLMADMYEYADEAFAGAGLPWYELSNWAVPGQECRHNVAYWRGDDWWGIGPGAHSHLSGTRWWNVKHPATYVARLSAHRSPAAGREVLDRGTRAIEDLMLGLRTARGIPVAAVDRSRHAELGRLSAEGLGVVCVGRFRLTRTGRLLADAVVRRLVP